MNLRHITRFTYEFTNFQGWRVAISRQGTTLARYFSDKQYGSSEAAREQALSFRDMVLAEISSHPEMTRDILYKYRVKSKKLQSAEAVTRQSVSTAATAGVFPECRTGKMGSHQMMLDNLKKLCHYLQLDAVGMLRLSLSLFILQYNTVTAAEPASERSAAATLEEVSRFVSGEQLQQVVDLLENNPSLFSESRLAGNEPYPHVSTQVPDEEIRAKESTNNMHNTSPPVVFPPVSQADPPDREVPRSDRHPRFSYASTPLRLHPVFPVSPEASQHPLTQKTILPHHYPTGDIAPQIDLSKSKRIDQGLEYAIPRPTDVI